MTNIERMRESIDQLTQSLSEAANAYDDYNDFAACPFDPPPIVNANRKKLRANGKRPLKRRNTIRRQHK